MLKTTVTEDRREIFTIVKAFLTGRYEAEKLLYNHVSYENIEGSRYNVRIYNDELSFTKMGRIWLVRETESFESDFEKETMENVNKKIIQKCIKSDEYIKELCGFPINGELTVVKNEPASK